jgi:ubiquinone biosynthesis UbiH/UbiF/VisC/COQ6 family hydroxylase
VKRQEGEAFDLVVFGGGIVGLLFVQLLLQRLPEGAGPRIAVVEPHPPAPPLPDIDLRVAALSPASRLLLESTGAWERLPAAKSCAYERMRVWQGAAGPTAAHTLVFDAAEAGLPELGHIIENHALRLALWQQLESGADCEFITAAADALQPGSAAVHIGIGPRQITAPLVVGADGAQSWLRERLRVAQREHDYGQRGIVCHLQPEIAHAGTAWQKFLAGGPAALLPLADGRVSLVWTVSAAAAEGLLALSDAEFAARLAAELDGVLGEFRCTTPRADFPLLAAHAEHYTGERFALLGDAAHRVHPLAGQGLNLGIQDADVLAAELAREWPQPAADPGDARILRRFERRRRGDVQLTLSAMTVLNRLFASPVAGLAGTGMGLLNRAPGLKVSLARYATGS